ncbi:hypothetical protein D3C80_773660 [compost metagenome]
MKKAITGSGSRESRVSCQEYWLHMMESTRIPTMKESTRVSTPSPAVISTAWMSLVAWAIRSPVRWR